jgi:two-component system phosphate regulon response regulator OmpR
MPEMAAPEMGIDDPHILVVDDDKRLRDLLNRYLKENGFRVTPARDAADARHKLASFDVDLIVLDVMMPGESGFELTESLRQTSRVPILLLTAMAESEDRIGGLERGADDYLAKPFEPRELVLRIRTILRRIAPPAPTPQRWVQFGACRFDPLRGELHGKDGLLHLTSVDISLLKVLADHVGAVLSREQLADLAGIKGGLRSIDVQVNRLRRKIEANPRLPRHLITVWGKGYVLRTD